MHRNHPFQLHRLKLASAALACSLAVAISSNSAEAQTPPAGEIEALKRQLSQLQASFEQAQKAHQAQLEQLRSQIQQLQTGATTPTAVAASTNPAGSRSATTASTSSAATSPAAEASTASRPDGKPWSPTDPIRLGSSGKAYMDVSVVGTMALGGSTAKDLEALQIGGHDPKQNGFTLQALETTFSGAVDPYFRAQANIAFQLDSAGETGVELEEAFLETTSLPGNFQLRAGQFLTEFGRQNPTHPHSWAFVDQPLVLGRLLGPDGLRSPGMRLSWLAPTPFYSELFFTVQNSAGETVNSFRYGNDGNPLFGRPVAESSIRSFNELLFSSRYAASFEIAENQTLLAGVSGAWGPNGSGSDTRTEIYGADWTWKWKSPRHEGGFPFVSWQTEGLLRRYRAGAADLDLDADGVLDLLLPRETLVDYGFYSQVSYGISRGWVAALRGEYVAGDAAAWHPDADRDMRWRISPNLTWFPTEFSKLRLQYNHDRREFAGADHSIWLQLEFLLGAHAAHKF